MLFNIIDIMNKDMNIVKIIIVYFMVMLSFYIIHSNLMRFIVLLLLYIFSVILFNINYKLGFLYFLTGIGAALTEHIFIKYIHSSWDYRNPNLLTIPFWLIPEWGLAIIIVTELSIIFTKRINGKDK
jgi:hypothetical protein